MSKIEFLESECLVKHFLNLQVVFNCRFDCLDNQVNIVAFGDRTIFIRDAEKLCMYHSKEEDFISRNLLYAIHSTLFR